MRIAYLASLYPAPSHTFIEREILELERLGVEVLRFSVRRPARRQLLDETARGEAARTRSLVPPPAALAAAAAWAVLTRPVATARAFWHAVSKADSIGQVAKWCAYFGEALPLAWWIRQGGAEHLHCHFGNPGSNTAALAARIACVPFSITFHGIDLDEPKRFRHADKLRDCSFAVCISDFGRRLLLTNCGGSRPDKVHVVRCGVPPAPENVLRPPPNENRIICVARLSPEKGHRVLLDALRLLKDRDVPFHCTLVGTGPLEAEIRSEIELSGLADDVTMTGAKANAEVLELIGQADLAVLSSLGEGIPMVLMEAFAQQRPVVATAVGGIPELVSDGRNGRLVAPGDPAALADAMASVLSDRGRARSMGEAGRRDVLSRHDPKRAAAKMRSLFDQSIRFHGA